jgi:hypothetical protein
MCLIVGRQIDAVDAGLEAEGLGVSWLGMKFGERMGVRSQVPVGTVGSATDYFVSRLAMCLLHRCLECGELKGRLSDQSQRLGHLAATLNELGYGMGVRQDNWSEGRSRCSWPRSRKHLRFKPSAA